MVRKLFSKEKRPPRRVAEVYETFELFDDGTGCIHQSNFEVIIKAMGGHLTTGKGLTLACSKRQTFAKTGHMF